MNKVAFYEGYMQKEALFDVLNSPVRMAALNAGYRGLVNPYAGHDRGESIARGMATGAGIGAGVNLGGAAGRAVFGDGLGGLVGTTASEALGGYLGDRLGHKISDYALGKKVGVVPHKPRQEQLEKTEGLLGSLIRRSGKYAKRGWG